MGWILFTFLAASMQAWRNAFQSQLSKDVNTAAVTLARFLWATPIALVYLGGLYYWQPVGLPFVTLTFSLYVLAAAAMQILATVLMVKLFKMRNFAVGAGLAKSEALMAAIFGVVFFGTYLSWLGWLGVLLGGVAVFIMSSGHKLKQISIPTVMLGIACGSAFALTSLWVRAASLSLDLPFPHRAAWVLLFVIAIQTSVLVLYAYVVDRRTIDSLLKRPKLTLLTSTTSCLGSIGWFSAMSLQTVPYVKTLGQIEVFFTLLIAAFWLKEKVKIKDMAALVMIAIAAILVMWG
ncbi:multidrug transporter [Shewanella sp. Choline-02u-19]|uniref:DMT family transporter n=1 Tax=unclassified Shewanella TaxID=196818 RepID=UPI000C3237C9|nr:MULTISPECIES: DMT family transporter [unclassified Shewanella]PKH58444.1 multidrug transporter [Shewanella sp. Bg11-22]PKI26517.1 multidrug transporter [Shewanella sp. Choline-02u-19]